MDPLRCVFVRAIGHSTTLPLTAIRSEAAVGRHDHRIDLSEYALHPVERGEMAVAPKPVYVFVGLPDPTIQRQLLKIATDNLMASTTLDEPIVAADPITPKPTKDRPTMRDLIDLPLPESCIEFARIISERSVNGEHVTRTELMNAVHASGEAVPIGDDRERFHGVTGTFGVSWAKAFGRNVPNPYAGRHDRPFQGTSTYVLTELQ